MISKKSIQMIINLISLNQIIIIINQILLKIKRKISLLNMKLPEILMI